MAVAEIVPPVVSLLIGITYTTPARVYPVGEVSDRSGLAKPGTTKRRLHEKSTGVCSFPLYFL